MWEQKEQVKRLHLLLTVKDNAANIPKNLEARRRLQFFTNSLFMDMPQAKPVFEMMPFWYVLRMITLVIVSTITYSILLWNISLYHVTKLLVFFPTILSNSLLQLAWNSVFTPYYSETVLYSNSDLRVENEDGISILFYLQKIFPGFSLILIGCPAISLCKIYNSIIVTPAFTYKSCFCLENISWFFTYFDWSSTFVRKNFFVLHIVW